MEQRITTVCVRHLVLQQHQELSFLLFLLYCFRFSQDRFSDYLERENQNIFEFGVRFFRIFLFFIWLDALQPITSTFFTSIGKPAKGIFLSLTRQIIFFIPLLLILPHFMGIEGCIYCGPIADFLAAVVTIIMAFLEFKNMPKTNGE